MFLKKQGVNVLNCKEKMNRQKMVICFVQISCVLAKIVKMCIVLLK